MPTPTFYRLPEEKKSKIFLAIKKEFSRVSFVQVSINKIIQAAGISRGSFYQYFQDKNDMIEYLLCGYKQQMMQFVKDSLKQSGGDLFDIFAAILKFTVGLVTDEETYLFCKNLFADLQVNSSFYLKTPKGTMEAELIEEFRPFIDLDLLDLRSEEDLSNMLDILCSTCRNALVEVFLNIENYKEIKEQYCKELALLKRGFTKNKE